MFSRKASYMSNGDRASVEVDRSNSGPQVVHLSSSGRRTMSLEEDDEDEGEAADRWNLIRASSGPMSSVSESGSQVDIPDPSAEVKVLCVSNLAKGCTSRDIYSAFDVSKQEVKIEIQSTDTALLHFTDSERAMKAYFAYLSSTNSIGTVNPHEPGVADSFTQSPVKQSNPQLRNRRSFQGSNGNVLTALTNISSWRSSDKLSTGKDLQHDREFRPTHRSMSSRSSLHSKSADKLPLAALSMTSTPLPSSTNSPAFDQTSFSSADSPLPTPALSTRSNSSSTARPPPCQGKQTKPPSTARRIISAGLSLRIPRRDKSEKEHVRKQTA